MSPSNHPPRIPTWQLSRVSWWWAGTAVVMIAAGWLKTINLLLLFGYLMLGLFGINAWVARSVARRVTATRVPLPPGFAGQPVVRSIDVTNTSTRPAEVSLGEESAVHTASFYVPSLAPGETRRVFAEFTGPVRGRYPVTPLSAGAGYPFGLLRFNRPLTDPDELVLLPAVGEVDRTGLRRWLVRTGAGDEFSRRPVPRQSATSVDVRGVRPYRPGDSPRDVHWRTTARRNDLMVREYDSTEPLELVLVVEAWLPAAASAADRDRLEAALSLAASIFWAWCHGEDAPVVSLVLLGRASGVRTGRAGEWFARDALTLLAGAEGWSDTRSAAGTVPRRWSSRCSRILVTSRPDTRLAADLRARTGVPFVPLSPADPVAWYTPPSRVAHPPVTA